MLHLVVRATFSRLYTSKPRLVATEVSPTERGLCQEKVESEQGPVMLTQFDFTVYVHLQSQFKLELDFG